MSAVVNQKCATNTGMMYEMTPRVMYGSKGKKIVEDAQPAVLERRSGAQQNKLLSTDVYG